MKVLHFILGKANKERVNGVNQVVAGLAKYCARQRAQVRVIGKTHTVARQGERIVRDGFDVEAYSRLPDLHRALKEAIGWADLVHLHGAYSPWNLWAAHLCERTRRPFVLTLHDGLAPERAALRGTMRKRVFHTLMQRRHLRAAAAVHVLAEEEATDLFRCARPRHVFCIPNGVDLEDYPPCEPRPPRPADGLVFGYLGRLSPEKNLDALCDAFAAFNGDGRHRLLLAGPPGKLDQALLRRHGGSGVEIVGPRFGADKLAFLRSVDVFVHPSLCDVFSIAAMEALALGVPLLITRTAKASHFYADRPFLMCEPTAFGLERGMREALVLRTELPRMAARGRALVERRFDWDVAARQLLAQYSQLLDRDSH